MRSLATLLLSLVAAGAAAGAIRADSTRVTITYVAGDAVYLSVGRDAGVADSSLCYVMDRRDTAAVLKVIAMSSKSSVCRVVRTKRPLAVGDVVIVPVAAAPNAPPAVASPVADSAVRATVAPLQRTPKVVEIPPFALHGRVNAQYSATSQSSGGPTIRRPGLVLNLRGAARDVPLTFDFYGNFRSLSYGGPLFGAGSVNQNRIYTLSLQYDDGSNRIAAGRLSQPLIGSAGYVDGITYTRRLDDLSFGVSGGFEPLFSQRGFGSDYRKFSLFANYAVTGSVPATAAVAYTRSFFHTALERDVATGSATVAPDPDWLVIAQGDVDLHTKRGDALIAHPRLSNLYSSVRYRITQSLSAGLGVSAWRPTYAFSTVAAIPDSQLDHALRTSPTANISYVLPSGISLYETFSSRSSDAGFGKEFSNYTSFSAANLFGEGLSARGSLSFNTTAYVKMRGWGGALQKSFFGVADATVRYQWYRYAYTSWDGVATSKTAGVDLMLSAFSSLTLWGSVERMMSRDANTTTFFLDLGWRF